MKIAVFWVVAPCSLVEVYQRFRGPCCLHHQGDELIAIFILTAVRTSNLTQENEASEFVFFTSEESLHQKRCEEQIGLSEASKGKCVQNFGSKTS
jgi:hypothetical protein